MSFERPQLYPNFIWWQGVVEDVNDPLKLGRCRVRIVGYHTDDLKDLPVEKLPWAHCIQPITSAASSGVGHSPTGMVPGTWVIGFFQDGEGGQHPIILGTFGGINPEKNDSNSRPPSGFKDPSGNYPRDKYERRPDTNKLARGEELDETILVKKISGLKVVGTALNGGWREPATPYTAIYPHNKVYESESGHIFEVDDTPGVERLHKYHKSGTFEEIHPDGTQVEKIKGDNYQIIEGDDRKLVEGSASVNVRNGGLKVSVDGNVDVQGLGNYLNMYFRPQTKVTLNTGTVYHKVHGKYIIDATEGIVLNAPMMDLNQDQLAVLLDVLSKVPLLGKLKPNNQSNGPASSTTVNLFGPESSNMFGIDFWASQKAYYDVRQRRKLIFTDKSVNAHFSMFVAADGQNPFLSAAVVIPPELGTEFVDVAGIVSENPTSEFLDQATSSLEGGLQQVLGPVEQIRSMAQDVASQIGGAVDTACALKDLLNDLGKGVSAGSPAELFEKIAEIFQPIADFPKAIGEAAQQLVEGAVNAVGEFVAGLAQPFVDLAEGVASTFEGASDPCAENAGGAAADSGVGGLETGGSPQASPGAVSGTNYEKTTLEEMESEAGVADSAAAMGSLPSPLDGLSPASSTKIAGQPIITLSDLGSVAGFAGLALGLSSLIGEDGQPIVGAGGTGPTGPTGPGAVWGIAEPTTATNLEGIPQGTTFATGISTTEILKALLYPSFLSFTSFDIGINSGPHEVGFTSQAGDYVASWEVRDPEEAVEDSLTIKRDSTVLLSEQEVVAPGTSGNSLNISHPAYNKTNEGDLVFTISLSADNGSLVTATDSVRWNYPLYTGKTSGSTLTNSDLSYFEGSAVQGDGKLINYSVSGMKSGITRNYASSSEPRYFYWITPKAVNGTDITNYPEYGLQTSFADVTNPSVSQPIPMQKLSDITKVNQYGLSITYSVYRSSNDFTGSGSFTRIRIVG